MKGSKELFLEEREKEVYEDEMRFGHIASLSFHYQLNTEQWKK